MSDRTERQRTQGRRARRLEAGTQGAHGTRCRGGLLGLALAGLGLLAVLPSALARQDSGDAAPASEQGSARALLDLAVQAQGHDPEQVDPEQLKLHAKMFVKILSERGDDVTLRVETKFLGPDMIWKKVIEGDQTTITAFDGEIPWSMGQDGRPIELVGADYAEDRQRLKDDRTLTKTLARLFLLGNLAGELEGLRRLPDESGEGKTAFVLEGRIEKGLAGSVADGEAPQPVTLKLWLEKETFHLLGCRIQPDDREAEPLTLCFWGWKKGEDGTGWIPSEIKIHTGDRPEPDQRITPTLLVVGARLTRKDFSPR